MGMGCMINVICMNYIASLSTVKLGDTVFRSIRPFVCVSALERFIYGICWLIKLILLKALNAVSMGAAQG